MDSVVWLQQSFGSVQATVSVADSGSSVASNGVVTKPAQHSDYSAAERRQENGFPRGTKTAD